MGADLSYEFGGDTESMTVAPDTIVVKPQPQLSMDYFLTKDVMGDDPFTTDVEAAVPYTLGLRVHNAGFGIANDLAIESAQPRIIEMSKAWPLILKYSVVP